jgi:RNA polymerase sigma-70 factor (ECF subfamily)
LTALIPILGRRRPADAERQVEVPEPRPPGSAASFQDLVLPHMDAAYTLARFLARSAAAADDIVQESFLRAYRSFGTYRGGDAKAWLLAIVRNCFFNWSRANARWRRPEGAPDSSGDSDFVIDREPADPETPEISLLREYEVEAVRDAIEELPEPFREALVLRELEDLAYRDIARITGVPIGTVMSRLARARRQLGVKLGGLRP